MNQGKKKLGENTQYTAPAECNIILEAACKTENCTQSIS